MRGWRAARGAPSRGRRGRVGAAPTSAAIKGGAKQGSGTVFEIAKTAGGYASTPTTLVSFCLLANCVDGAQPEGRLIADANGNLFGTTVFGGAHGHGTVFEIAKT